MRGAGKGGGRGGTQDTPNTPLSLQNPNSPRRSKSLKHKNGEGAGLAPLGGAGKRGGASLWGRGVAMGRCSGGRGTRGVGYLGGWGPDGWGTCNGWGLWGGGALPGRGRWQWEGALGVPGRARPWAGPPSPLLSPRRDRREPRSLQGEPGMRGDGCQSLISPPGGVLLPPQEGPPSSPRPDPALCPPVQQLGWNQLRDAGPRGAADAAHHGAGTGGPQLGRGAPQGMGLLGSLPAGSLACPSKLTCPFPPQQCGVISEHTKKMCTR